MANPKALWVSSGCGGKTQQHSLSPEGGTATILDPKLLRCIKLLKALEIVVAMSSMVQFPAGTVNSPSPQIASSFRPSAQGVFITSLAPVAQANHMEVTPSRLLKHNCSPAVADIMLASCRLSTMQIYNSIGRHSIDGVREKKVDPLRPSIPSLQEFLQDGQMSGLSSNSTPPAGITMFLPSYKEEPVTRHLHIQAVY